MNAKIFVCALFCTIFSLSAYDFRGTHFFASYKECNLTALKDIETLKKVFEDAVKASNATILDYSFVDFGPESTTGTFILSESHASIHTYPEHAACFVDLFTCGSHCVWEPFHAILITYLQPQEVDKQVVIRS